MRWWETIEIFKKKEQKTELTFSIFLMKYSKRAAEVNEEKQGESKLIFSTFSIKSMTTNRMLKFRKRKEN